LKRPAVPSNSSKAETNSALAEIHGLWRAVRFSPFLVF
jgi:hypothetical protein